MDAHKQSFLVRLLTTRNVAWWDRVLRALPAPLVLWLYLTGRMDSSLALPLGIVSGMLLVTTLMASCSIYYMLGMSTCPVSGKVRSAVR